MSIDAAQMGLGYPIRGQSAATDTAGPKSGFNSAITLAAIFPKKGIDIGSDAQ
jgi:hypothetical protein